MKRRNILKGICGASGSVLTAGCLDRLGLKRQSAWQDPPLPENRPPAVYYPAIVEEMGMYGLKKSSRIGVALMYSYPHRFWNLTGSNKNKVVVQPDDSLHLMANVWDTESQTILPTAVNVTVRKAGEMVTTNNMWPMISPSMGFHYGDNISLPEEGQYTAEIQIGGLTLNRTEPIQDLLSKSAVVQIPFNFDTDKMYNLEIQRLNNKAGTRGTVDLNQMNAVPEPTVPAPKDLPGQLLGVKSTGDAEFVLTAVDPSSVFGTNNQYLLCSPRTPYNNVMLPRMNLSAKIQRDQSVVRETTLEATIDPEMGTFYGAPAGDLQPGDTVRVEIHTPPQLARHDGYESAFIEMPAVEFAF